MDSIFHEKKWRETSILYYFMEQNKVRQMVGGGATHRHRRKVLLRAHASFPARSEYFGCRQQEGGLCAQHCLNSLLQGPYYTAVDLAEFARQLDDAEKERMSEGDTNTTEYLKFMEQPSSNMNDSGFFSIQVLCKALQVWELDLIPFSSPDAALVRQAPIHEKAFICNLQQHWFTIRKLGQQWFNLNSTQTGPVLISETYLSLYLAQLKQEGYSIFIVKGSLPTCEADKILMNHRVSPAEVSKKQNMLVNSESATQPTLEPAKTADPEEVRRKRMQYFDRMNNSKGGQSSSESEIADKGECSSKEESLQKSNGSKKENGRNNCENSNQSSVILETPKNPAAESLEETEEELLKAAIELSKLQK